MDTPIAGPSNHYRSASLASTRYPPTPSTRNPFPTSPERDFDSEIIHDIDLDAHDEHVEGEEGVHFVLLAEFDIDAGATLSHQYPYPTGTEEHRLAELMLPDGAHLRTEDWTVFYLGQTPSSAINPMFTHENASSINDPSREKDLSDNDDKRHSTSSTGISHQGSDVRVKKRGVAGGGLLYVLNCVRQKEDKKMRRGAMVKALAVCSPNPYVQIYKPLLLLAMEEYFLFGSVDTLAKLYDCCNSISTYGMPKFTRNEKILLRQSEHKDILIERYLEEIKPAHTEDDFDQTENLDDGDRSPKRQSRSADTGRISRQSMGSRKLSSGSSQFHAASSSTKEARRRKGVPRDTHVFETEAQFAQVTVPIRIPMTVFDEDVGDYSLIEFFRAFSQDTSPFSPPLIPYLHTNGANTHPIILILNAMLAHKRVVFLGNQMPANIVARIVLAACAFSTGAGQVLNGVTESAFPYANLASLDILEQFSGYVAGVTNPRFGDLTSTWDVLCDVETGKVTVSKEVKATTFGVLKSGRSSDSSLHNSFTEVDENFDPIPQSSKISSSAKADCVDNQFVEEVLTAINGHFGETHVRCRVNEYMTRFLRLASNQEFVRDGRSTIGFPTRFYSPGKLGCGVVWSGPNAQMRELQANVHRIDAWRRTRSYRLCQKDWKKFCKDTRFNFDLGHQISRLRYAKSLSDIEAEEIYSAIARSLHTYDQVTELLTHLPGYLGGLMPIANGLFHRYPGVREAAADILLSLQHFALGRHVVSTMNYFHRKSLLHSLEQREKRENLAREFAQQVRIEGEGRASENGSDGSTRFTSPRNTIQGSPGFSIRGF